MSASHFSSSPALCWMRYFHFWLGQLGLQPVWDEVQAAVDKLLG